MRLFPRRRFTDLVERQLDLFADANRSGLADLREAYRQVNAAGREGAEEAFGEYQDQVDWVAEELAALRDTYASTLEDDVRDAYVRAFARGVRRRFPPLATVMMRRSGDLDEI